MKKQRTNNPRFLGSLGFLGFLGFLGSQNPGITRWAWLSLLSLFSLLVLLPTQDVATATYTLNPKKKWMLILLGCLGFLGFLASDTPPLAGLACLSILSQMAISQKQRGTKLGLAFGFAIGISFVMMPLIYLIHPMAAVLVPLLVIPSLLPFVPVIKGKERFPLRDLIPIFMLLFAAIILPAIGVFWFMNQAMRNEQMALRQQVADLYTSQLNMAKDAVHDERRLWINTMGRYTNLPSAQRFEALVKAEISDSIFIFCENRRVLYPENTEAATEDNRRNTDALAPGIQVKAFIRDRAFPEARKMLEKLAEDETMRYSRDGSGRLVLPSLMLFYIQTAPEAAAMVESLREIALDYTIEMPSARRLFLLQTLEGHGEDVEPWLGAELLAAELEELPWENVKPQDPDRFAYLERQGVFVLFSEDGQVAAVSRKASWINRMQGRIDSLPILKDARIVIEPQGFAGKQKPRMSGADISAGWVLNLYTEGKDPFSAHAKHRRKIHMGIGIAVVCIMSVICGLLVRLLLAQQKLTRMKNDFVATVTHELKTPLASTRLFVDTLLDGRCRDDQQKREYLELIARETKRLSRLIDNFLTFSRMERNKRNFNFVDVEPSSIAATAADAVRENFECAGCRLSVEVAGNLPHIFVDADAMVTVLLNLLDNACKYSEGEKNIELSVYEQEHAICFRVEDNGIGMAKRELARIMDRFYQIDQSLTRKVGGAGLGLSIVNFIIEAHGATIDVQSELGKGSVFTVIVPLNGGKHGS